jgi:ATP phosphoribosyltransferase regulatory subunit
VVRRRAERSRRERQIQQAGIELMGQAGPEGDLEVLTVAASAVRGAGLSEFTLDLGHAGIANALVSALHPEVRRGVVAALSAKDADETRRRAERGGLAGAALAALVELPSLYGGADVWARADRALAGTAAVGPANELRALYDAADRAGLAPRLVADLGETWTFAYYTGMLFQVLADGPGEAVGSGGRYDRLFDRFSAPRPAAGFAIDVGNLGWALERAGFPGDEQPRVLVTAETETSRTAVAPLLGALRRASVRSAEGPSGQTAALAYARAWRFTHWVEVGARLRSVDVALGTEVEIPFAGEASSVPAALLAALRIRTPNREAT